MPLSLMLWALFVVPLWMLLLSPLAHPDAPTVGFAAAAIGLTVAAYVADRRLGAPGPARFIWPERLRWLGFALLAGLGITILASDLGNVMNHIVGARIDEGAPPADPTSLVIKLAVFQTGLLLVVIGVAQRSLLAIHRPWVAIVITVLVSVLPTGTPIHTWPQWVLLVGLPAWLFRHTRSVALALVAYAPTIALPLVGLAGIAPGIPGFDLIEPGTHVFQPVWFDLLGAALVAAGVGPLLRDFEAIERDIEAVEPPADTPSGDDR